MKKLIEFQTSKNHTSALLTPRKPNAYDDLVLVDAYRKYTHRFAPGKTKIRLLPAISTDSNWLMEIPVLQHMNGRHCHPRVIKADAESVYDLAYKHMKEKCPKLLFNRANKSGIRLLPMPVSICWAIVEDANGIKVRLLLNSFYDGEHGGASGLGDTIYKQVLRAGEKCDLPGHPLNHLDGTSILVERIGGSDTKFPSYLIFKSDSWTGPACDQVCGFECGFLELYGVLHFLIFLGFGFVRPTPAEPSLDWSLQVVCLRLSTRPKGQGVWPMGKGGMGTMGTGSGGTCLSDMVLSGRWSIHRHRDVDLLGSRCTDADPTLVECRIGIGCILDDTQRLAWWVQADVR